MGIFRTDTRYYSLSPRNWLPRFVRKKNPKKSVANTFSVQYPGDCCALFAEPDGSSSRLHLPESPNFCRAGGVWKTENLIVHPGKRRVWCTNPCCKRLKAEHQPKKERNRLHAFIDNIEGQDDREHMTITPSKFLHIR